MKLFVGLDVSSEKLDACFMTDDSTLPVLKEATFENSQIGASQIKELILEFSQNFEIEKLVIGMQATSLYSFHLALQYLTRTRYQLIKQLVRTKQHFIKNIYYKCNTLSKELKPKVDLY